MTPLTHHKKQMTVPPPYVTQAYSQPQQQPQMYTQQYYADVEPEPVQQDNYRQPLTYDDAPVHTTRPSTSTAGQGDDVIAILLFILGFVFAVIPWIVCWVLYRNSPNQSARTMAKISMVLCLLCLLVFVLPGILAAISFGVWAVFTAIAAKKVHDF